MNHSTTTKKMVKLDFKRMVQEISNLVETEFCEEMSIKQLPKSAKFTQKEANKMVEILGKVYLISHCIHCRACSPDYQLPTPKKK